MIPLLPPLPLIRQVDKKVVIKMSGITGNDGINRTLQDKLQNLERE